MTKVDDTAMVVVSQGALVVALSEAAPSEVNLRPVLVEPAATILSAVPAQLRLPLERTTLRAVLVAAFLAGTNLQPVVKQVDSSVGNQAQLLQAGCLGQRHKTQALVLEAQGQAVRILSVPAKHKTNLAYLVAPAAGLEAAQPGVGCSVVLRRPHLEQLNRRKARIRSVVSAHRISKASKVKTKTNQVGSLEAEDLELRRLRNHSLLVACLAELSRQRVVADYLAEVHLGRA